MNCDVGEVTERLENEQSYIQYNEQSSFSNISVTSPTLQLIIEPFRRFTYITAHSPTLLLLHLRHSSFSNPSVALPTSQLILQPFCRFIYVTAHSPTLLLLLLCHSPWCYLAHNSVCIRVLHTVLSHQC